MVVLQTETPKYEVILQFLLMYHPGGSSRRWIDITYPGKSPNGTATQPAHTRSILELMDLVSAGGTGEYWWWCPIRNFTAGGGGGAGGAGTNKTSRIR